MLRKNMSKIIIFGAGLSGSYLGNLLHSKEYNFEIIEPNLNAKCPSPCAFGFANYSLAKHLTNKIGLDLENFVLAEPKEIILNNYLEVKIKDLKIVNKPALIKQLRANISNIINNKQTNKIIINSSNNLIVDATGYKRAIIGNGGTKIKTKQIKVKTNSLNEEQIYVYVKPYGYSWAFPLGNNTWHIGAGAFTEQQTQFLFNKLIEILNLKDNLVKLCSCTSFVNWFSCYDLPFVKNNIVAIGEAGGFITAEGEGNTLALESAYLLFKCIEQTNNPFQIANLFKQKALKHFKWLKYKYLFIKSLNNKKILALLLLPIIIKIDNKRCLNVKFNLKILKFLKNLWKDLT